LPPAGPFVKATLAVFGRDLARNRKKEKIDVAEAGMPMRRLLIAAAILPIHGVPAEALLLWNWRYSGAGVSASGTFTTNDATDGVGFYQIVGISGADNGVRISGLQPTGTAISGNEPYVVDNLVSAAEPHLTTHGFGFSLANGNYANPFYKTSSYYEHLSVPPYINGAGPERPVAFSAAIVPEPSAASLQLAGLVDLVSFALISRRSSLDRTNAALASSGASPGMISITARHSALPSTHHIRVWPTIESGISIFIIVSIHLRRCRLLRRVLTALPNLVSGAAQETAQRAKVVCSAKPA
jgi:hypothetical protein